MSELLSRIAGKGGSDILAADTYEYAADTTDTRIYKPIVAVEYSSANFTLTNVEDVYGNALEELAWLDGPVAITQDMGIMVFPTAVGKFTTDVQVKVWYA